MMDLFSKSVGRAFLCNPFLCELDLHIAPNNFHKIAKFPGSFKQMMQVCNI